MPVNTHTSVNPFLKILQDAILRLPETIPLASTEDHIYQSFHGNPAHGNGRVFAALERTYIQCFKPDSQGPAIVNNVLRGENGMDLVTSYLEAIAKPSIMNPDELKSTNNLIRELVGLVHRRIRDAPKVIRCHPGGQKPVAAQPQQGKQYEFCSLRCTVLIPQTTEGDAINHLPNVSTTQGRKATFLQEEHADSAITFFIASLGSNKPKGKVLARALKLQDRWAIRNKEWELVELLINVLKPFQTATEAMSRRDVATIADVIPTFSILERKLIESAAKLRGLCAAGGRESASAQALLVGLEAGLGKTQQYWSLAHSSDLCLVSTILNPRLRLKYLERWPSIHSRAKVIFTYIFENYRSEVSNPTMSPAGPATTTSSSPVKLANSWESEIYSDVPSFVERLDRELQEFLFGSYPCSPEMSTLGWWKLYGLHFPVTSHMARDFMCIPAASVSVERLFSQ
ncbi:hypothetical protein FRC11_008235, partial [Ceratobasidium sp. 423]